LTLQTAGVCSIN